MTAFTHALVGGTTSESFFSTEIQGNFFEDVEGFSSFLVQPGLGVDFKGGHNFGVRLQLDYQWVTAEDYDDNFRFIIAAVMYLY